MIELIVVIAIIGILAAVIIPNFTGFVEKAKEGADKADIRNLNGVTIAYRAEEPKPDKFSESGTEDSESLMNFLVEQGFIGQVLVPRSENGSFDWDFQQERWVLKSTGETGSITKTSPETIMESLMDLLAAVENRDPAISIGTFLLNGGNPNSSTGGVAYRTYILNNTFNGTWPSFPTELQGTVIPDVTGLKIMPFIRTDAKNDPVIYAGTDLVNWNSADLFYSEGNWYRHRNPSLLYKPNTYSNFKYYEYTGTELTAEIKSNPQLWDIVQ